MKKTEENPVEICVENFEEMLARYKPLLLTAANNVRKSYHLDARLEHEDLMSCGSFALYKAIQTWKPEAAYFGHYAKTCIINEMRQHARLHLPHYYVKDGNEKHSSGTQRFKRISVNVGSIDADNFFEGLTDAPKRKTTKTKSV